MSDGARLFCCTFYTNQAEENCICKIRLIVAFLYHTLYNNDKGGDVDEKTVCRMDAGCCCLPVSALAGCGGTAQAPDAGPSEPAVLEADDGAYCAAISAYYSDTHFTEWTVKLGRVDGQPMEESFTPQGAVVEPDPLGGSFGEVACSPGDSWYEEGSFFINYRIFTRPVHQEISIRYTRLDGQDTDLLLTFSPESAPYKEAGEMEFPDGLNIVSALVSERSGMVIMTLPEGQVSRLNAACSIVGGDGEILWEGRDSLTDTASDQPGRVQYAYHFFFDEDDPLPLDEAASIILNGNEIPLSEYSE